MIEIKRSPNYERNKRYRDKKKRMRFSRKMDICKALSVHSAQVALDSRYNGFWIRCKSYNEACKAGIVFA